MRSTPLCELGAWRYKTIPTESFRMRGLYNSNIGLRSEDRGCQLLLRFLVWLHHARVLSH